jgi:AAA15 family ATPase/GTPase
MLLRFTVQNFSSFKDAVEFNSFPSSKSHSHENHKMICNHATVLRLSAIYGANGAGKSNLLSAMKFIKELVSSESLQNMSIDGTLSFKFSNDCIKQPSELAIEFFSQNNVYYYHIEFDSSCIILEELFLSKRSSDSLIFRREKGEMSFNESFVNKHMTESFTDALKRLVRPDMLLLSFLGHYYQDESQYITDAYNWFKNDIEIVQPDRSDSFIPHLLDTNPQFAEMVNKTISKLNIGIKRISVRKEIMKEDEVKSSSLLTTIKKAKSQPGVPLIWTTEHDADIENIVYEEGTIYKKTIISLHADSEDNLIEMPITSESDGTRRLIEYMPLFYDITRQSKVYVVDEIERSMHPILIKDLIQTLSDSETAKGQLIFTTHESSLLDQGIFRPDEIWFAQKDVEQATQLYPLSDYNIHKTANIENGYLIGRYGGIPFLSNLKDLHW